MKKFAARVARLIPAPVRTWLAPRRKAIVGVALGWLANKLAQWGIDLSSTQKDALDLLLTGITVYVIPNTPKEG